MLTTFATLGLLSHSLDRRCEEQRGVLRRHALSPPSLQPEVDEASVAKYVCILEGTTEKLIAV
jgi:hypothetical protein